MIAILAFIILALLFIGPLVAFGAFLFLCGYLVVSFVQEVLR